MEDLSQDQKDVYNTYITNGIDKNDAEGLVRGTLSQEAFFSKLDAKEKPKDVNSLLDQEGYDTKLIEKVGKKVKERKESSEYLAESGPDDKAFLNYLKQNKPEVAKLGGQHIKQDGESDDDCPEDAVEVNVFQVDEGGRQLKVHKIYNPVEAPASGAPEKKS